MGVTERLLIMETINNIKIDQLRLNIPYDEIYQVEDSQGLPKEVIVADKLLHLAWLFKSNTVSHGHNGYTSSYNFGSGEQGGTISVMWNETRKDMGILVDFTATGKALYESLAELDGITVNWKRIIEELYKKMGHISRIDIATDLINYEFSVNQIIQRLKSEKSFFLNAQGNKINSNRFKIIGNYEEAQTLYVGSRKSDAFLRIYNKKIEQDRASGLYRNLARNCKDWIRVEAEFKHRLAKDIGKYIAELTADNIYPYLLGCVLERWSLVDKEK
jgi:DNA relaxase NicK